MKRELFCSAVVLLVLLGAPIMVLAAPSDPIITGPAPAPIAAPLNGNSILWDQLNIGTEFGTSYGVLSRQFEEGGDSSLDTFSADDFTNDKQWRIEAIHLLGPGYEGAYLPSVLSLHWAIYADDGGKPAGDPSGGGVAPVWSISMPPNDPRVIISPGDDSVTLNLGIPIDLAPGTWWLVFYPTVAYNIYNNWYWWCSSTSNGEIAQIINPGGGYPHFSTEWTNIQVTAVPRHDFAFRLDGRIMEGIPAMGIYGMVFFVLLLSVASVLVLRRKRIS